MTRISAGQCGAKPRRGLPENRFSDVRSSVIADPLYVKNWGPNVQMQCGVADEESS